MSFRLNASPRALLSMFGAKHEGRNPGDMSETIQCTADVLDNYLEQWFGTAENSAAPGIGDVQEQVTVTHAAGFMWRVWGVYSRVILAVGDIAIDSLHTLELITSGGTVVPLTPEPVLVTSSVQSRRVSFWFPRPIIVRPGVNFRSTCDLLTAPGAAWSITTGTYSQAVPD